MNNKIIIFFNGLRGILCLEEILSNDHNVSAVVTPENFFNSDFLHLTEKFKFKHFKKNNVNEQNFINELKKFNSDIFLIIGFAEIFNKELFNLPRLGTFNFHAGKLPKYRGGSPINWQIINNEKEVGVSIIKVNEKIDGGHIALSHVFKITKEDYSSDIHLKTNKIFAEMSIKLIDQLDKGKIQYTIQDESLAVYWHQRNDNDGYINFNVTNAEDAYNFIRAISHPYPGAWAILNRSIK